MPAQLLALNEGPSILLDKPILLLGRDLECDIRLDSRKISRRHCCIAQVGERLLVRDLGSTNGVRINGVRVLEGQLKAGDELMIGNFRYRIRWDPLSDGAAAAPVPAKLGKKSDKQKPAPAVPTQRAPDEDELLESCDEPVALPDPGEPLPIPVGKAMGPVPKPADIDQILDVQSDVSPPTPPSARKYPPIVPEQLDLAPPSDVMGNKDPVSPPPLTNTNHRHGKPTMPAADSGKSWQIPPS